jgi:hypothetical protein
MIMLIHSFALGAGRVHASRTVGFSARICDLSSLAATHCVHPHQPPGTRASGHLAPSERFARHHRYYLHARSPRAHPPPSSCTRVRMPSMPQAPSCSRSPTNRPSRRILSISASLTGVACAAGRCHRAGRVPRFGSPRCDRNLAWPDRCPRGTMRASGWASCSGLYQRTRRTCLTRASPH